MGGYPGTVYASPWLNFKPKHPAPWVIGISMNQTSLFNSELVDGIKQWAAANSGKVSKVISLVTSTANDVPTQIQQMQSLLQQHVDLLFVEVGSPSAENGVIDQAAEQGVPVVSINGQTTDKNAVTLSANYSDLGYYGAAGLVDAMGGKGGNVLVVQGLAGQTFDSLVLGPALDVLKACHVNLEGNGSIYGQYDSSAAKAAVFQFLAGHPSTINGVFQTSAMAPGIISAFQQDGRQVPPVADLNPGAQSLVYWKDHQASYSGSGVAIVPLRTGEYAMAIGLAMLEGRGLKVTAVPFVPPVITSANLDQWVEPGWTNSTVAQANGPAGAIAITQLVNGYMAKP